VAPSEPTTDSPAPRPRGWPGKRGGSVVLVGTLFAGVLVASIGTGYSATKANLDDAKANAVKGDHVVQMNVESQQIEAEAQALAPGKDELEVVTLHDGRVVTVNHKTNEVIVLQDPGLQNPKRTSPQSSPGTTAPEENLVTVVAGKDAGYVVDPITHTVRMIAKDGTLASSVYVTDATNKAVADRSAGVRVLTSKGEVVHVVGGVIRAVSGSAVEALTVADGRPIAITSDGKAIDITSDVERTVADQPVPHGKNTVVGSPMGAGRYLLVLDRQKATLIVVDPRTRSLVRKFTGLPPSSHLLGAPVILDNRIYVPDFDKTAHELLVFDLTEGKLVDKIKVPGESRTFSLEVRGHRVWANDQFDPRALVIDRDGGQVTIDTGEGDGQTDTSHPDTPTDSGSQPDTETPKQEPPAPPRKEPEEEPALPAPTVAVPAIEPGTAKQDACDRIRAAKLRCEFVQIGAGGKIGTVRSTDPPGGYQVPEQAVVRIHVYGALTVPNVVDLFIDRACEIVEGGTGSGETGPAMRCVREVAPEPATAFNRLNTVKEQDPAAGQEVKAGTDVTVRYWDQVTMPDLSNTNGADQCNQIIAAANSQVSCTVTEGSEAPNPNQAGFVESQNPAAGSPVKAGATIQLTTYRVQTPKVPGPFSGTSIAEACQAVESAGYTCVQQDDELARHANTVTRQEPAPGTPQAGGTVILHYSSEEPVPVYRWAAKNGDPVYVMRVGDEIPNENYQREPNPVGYAYNGGSLRAGTVPINGFFCATSKETCGGYDPNHYISRDTSSKEGFQAGGTLARFVNITTGQCPPGMIPIRRYFRHPGTWDYYFGSSSPWAADYTEELGCIWSP
jgi:beta-lactam-binding protein with PASTA domain